MTGLIFTNCVFFSSGKCPYFLPQQHQSWGDDPQPSVWECWDVGRCPRHSDRCCTGEDHATSGHPEDSLWTVPWQVCRPYSTCHPADSGRTLESHSWYVALSYLMILNLDKLIIQILLIEINTSPVLVNCEQGLLRFYVWFRFSCHIFLRVK